MTRIQVRAKPGSRKGPLVEVGSDAVVTVYVRERAVDGAANDAIVAALAAHYGISRRDVTLVRGHTARVKLFDIAD